ncbi:MAG TPA: acyl-CoA dehydratase activase [Bacteroidales bacterium]|nr:acyl-CoA dehydratase activase [Bacteroidales bacterium]
MRNSLYLGLDLGSVSLNTVVLDESFEVIEEFYDFIHGKPFHVLFNRLSDIISRYPVDSFKVTAITGSGAKKAAGLIGGNIVNEVIAQAKAVTVLYPEAKTVIEIGGEDSKLILLDTAAKSGTQLVDFEMNSICAAGTGSFLDQQAKRIGLSIENEFGTMALKSANPPRIAGRCSVFAKSDMIHLQQIATPLHDIVAGLCFALARNFKSTIAHGKKIEAPVVFSGGVAANAGMVRAFREVLDYRNGELIVPKRHASMGAIGAVLYTCSGNHVTSLFTGIEKLSLYLQEGGDKTAGLPRLSESSTPIQKPVHFHPDGKEKIPVYLGLDIGSLSTNLVLITEDHKVVDRRYLPTAGKPIEAIQRGLTEIYNSVGEDVIVMGAGTTGSGRYLTGDFIGADIIINEITAQATAAIDYDRSVDTIFEIGGQDSKYISIKSGVVVDFEMNKVCAAGTGSFLEEQAEKLNISIINEFGKLALDCDCPAKLGDRCTVFMESDLNSLQQKGASVDTLVGGLAYSIVNNYIQKVVGPRPVGKHIFFQGGVANNKSVVAAFEQVVGVPVTVPPNFDVTGAIGAAILARQTMQGKGTTRFKGFHMRDVPYTASRFDCKACSNECEIRKVVIEGESKPLFYGGRCEKYETRDVQKKETVIPNLFLKRLEFLQTGYSNNKATGQKTIGIPRALMIYYQQFPFWHTFFENLGYSVIVSRETDKKMVTRSLEAVTTEFCLPVELMHGHVIDLIEQGVDKVFLPFIVDARVKKGNPTTNCNCPWIQSHTFMVKAALRSQYPVERILSPVLHFRHFNTALKHELITFAHDQLGIKKSVVLRAIQAADSAQMQFESGLREFGRKVMADIPKDCTPVVLLGRPYNTCDPMMNLGLVEKLIRHNLMPVPLDFLDLQINEIFTDYRSMYWPNGQKILAAARHVAKNDRLYAVYTGNFRCGPDSFILHYVDEELKGKPCLHLEVDEHSADAGMVTRIEAFIESLKGVQFNNQQAEKAFVPRPGPTAPVRERVLYFPYMNDNAHAISAAARSCGIPSEVLPMQDERDLELGRLYTSSRECFPMICTTGSFLKKLMEPGVDPSKVSFFMPDHSGPCRFGQYNHLQRIIFDKLGYGNAEILCPSNDSSYADIAGRSAPKFRFNAWRGFVAVDFIRKLRQETKPYEINAGDTVRAYRQGLQKIIHCIESGGKGLHLVLKEITDDFGRIPVDKRIRKPVVAVIGEIFMRDNEFCNGRLVQRLEELGTETVIAPFSEWITYSTYRYTRDSIWKRSSKGYVKSQLQRIVQEITERKLTGSIIHATDHEKTAHLKDILSLCEPYVHHDYDGDPPLAMGAASFLYKKGISGIAAILPFTCMPGTLISAVSDSFRKDHKNIPWINVAYDGQDTVSLETRLQAFVHQVSEFKVNW